MAQKIQRLSESVINQIAAGEVVESPASIVKELVENSLDAGASHIDIAIREGGQEWIFVEDDGCGMDREDALLCLERHATSKIREVFDLETLTTMGFRGEALAAVAAVSQFELRTSSGRVGTKIVSSGGEILNVEGWARNRGTTIEVNSLFFNVPARRKFQKSAHFNAAQVARVVETIALTHPEVAFSYCSQGKRVLSLQSSSWKERREEILGLFEHEISFEKKGIRISGAIGSPLKAQARRTKQYLFVNRRPIFSPLIARAIKEGFGTRIAEGMHPPFILFLELSPNLVDINVHPQKKEARFQDEGIIYNLFREAVASSFMQEIPTFHEPISFSPPEPFLLAETSPVPKFVEQELNLSYSEKLILVSGHFLLLQNKELILVDLHAAHARILFEAFTVKKGEVQTLIWPLEIEIDGEEITEEMEKLGIECRLLGKRTLAVDALPAVLDAATFPQFLVHWKEGRKLEELTSRFSKSGKKEYSLEEAALLWKKLQACQDRRYDPLGKPIWVEVKVSDFEQLMRKHV